MARIRENRQAYNAMYYRENRERIRRQQGAYRIANRGKIQAARKGLTVEQMASLLTLQDNRCAICSVVLDSPNIDHDHACCSGIRSCGKCVRGILCASCNHMLGKARDLPEVLESGAAYLRQHAGGDR